MKFDTGYFTGAYDYGYIDYHRDLLPFDHYAQQYAETLFSSTDTILIAGCAYGYTVMALVNSGYDAYGVDISSHAVTHADSRRVTHGDVRTDAGISNALDLIDGSSYDYILTECLLSCLTDTDAQTATTKLRDIAGTLGHRVWTAQRDLHPEYTSHTLAEWRSVCDSAGVDFWSTESDWQP